ncbi:hypothetical protein [Thermococcus pacificus]|uniref:Uncharacterized protein n=1 Tax=Thermococcus pacificus TaxID=71998 RepID=A0A218P7Y0_9EURY|nr:hypothetical protein [Thermococcus pacificus]ASJ06895.1 hypothetical protein A3L08_05930 [Thermococcus pacificus]
MKGGEIKGALAFVGILILGLLFFFGFLVIALALILAGLLLFLGFYAYLRLKLWWVRKHPPKELEGPEDYLF